MNRSTGPVFDVHARLVRQLGGLPALLGAMDRAGIDRAAASAGGLVDLDRFSAQIRDGGRAEVAADNDWVLECCAASGGRVIPFYFADPYADVDRYRSRATQFRGLEISPAVHGFRLDEPAVAALVETAAAARHAVYVVCLDRPGAQAADLVRLALAFPAVTFVFGHCGANGLDADGLARIAPVGNIVAETSGCFTATVRLALRRLGPDRVLFGTEYPLQDPTVELTKFASLGLPVPVWRRVAWTNAHRLVGEETPCPSP